MRKSILLFVVILTTLTSYIAKAETTTTAYTIETVPNVYVKDLRQHVSDPDGLLSAAARDSINRIFTALEQKTGIQAMVVMLPSIGDADVFDFTQELFRYWGIGERKRNNGLLITYVADQRTIRFHTGYGLEGFLTDAKSKRIQSQHMIPAFKQGNTDQGMVNGVKAVYQTLEKSMDARENGNTKDNPLIFFILFFIIISSIIYFVWNGKRVQNTCKSCHKPNSLKHMSTDYYKDNMGMKHRKDIFICSKCGHVDVRDRIIDDGNNGGSDILKGIIIGSMLNGFRGGGGGGGFSGGSFGGGSSGGGGASSSW